MAAINAPLITAYDPIPTLELAPFNTRTTPRVVSIITRAHRTHRNDAPPTRREYSSLLYFFPLLFLSNNLKPILRPFVSLPFTAATTNQRSKSVVFRNVVNRDDG